MDLDQTTGLDKLGVLPAMADITAVDLAVTRDGKVLMAYTKPFTIGEHPVYGEFDSIDKKLWFYTDDGYVRELGLDIPKKIERRFYTKDFHADLICAKEMRIYQAFHIPILVHQEEKPA